MKKKNRRSKVKYPALDPEFNLKSRSELIEADYINKLSEEEKEWLNRFNEEYVNASFNKNPKKNLHKSKKLKKDCYDRNNSRNRDILTRAKASGKFHYIDDLTGEDRRAIQDDIELLEEAEIDTKKS